MTPREVVVGARKLLSDPARWTQGTFARNARGLTVPALHPLAASFCVRGAVRRVTGLEVDALDQRPYDDTCALLDTCARLRGHNSAILYNDNRDHAGVLSLLDDALDVSP